MRTIETTATITAEGTLTVQVPPDIPPRPHHVVVLIDDQPGMPEARQLHNFPVIHVGAWPAELSLRREDMYPTFRRPSMEFAQFLELVESPLGRRSHGTNLLQSDLRSSWPCRGHV